MVIKERFGEGLVFVQGTKSFVEGLKKDGLNVTENYTDEAKAILVAFDPEITGSKMRTTCEMLTKHDLPYYATNPDWVCPVSFGSIPDCGSMCEGYARATGRMPVYIGKPQPTMVLELMKKFGVTADEAAALVNCMSSFKGSMIWVTFVDYADNIRVRLRSRNVAINEVASKYRGGGHLQACGATIYNKKEMKAILADLDTLHANFKENHKDLE